MFQEGFFNIHNKALISVDFLMDFANTMSSGSGLIEYLQNRILLLSECEGTRTDVRTNISNMSKDIEKMCIAVLSKLITDLDLNEFCCLICGNCPKIINSGEC